MSRGNRGKVLEKNIIQANAYYEHSKLAVITQMPTPVDITKVIANKVTGFLTRSTVDFYGTLKGGRSIYFDAKETNEPRFAVANNTKLHEHQIEYLRKQHLMSSLCFLIVDFTAEREAYLIPWPVVAKYLEEAQTGGRKSIPLQDCREREDIFLIGTEKGYLDYLAPIHSGDFGIL